MRTGLLTSILCLLAVGFAGCAEDAAPAKDGGDGPVLDVSDTTGGIRGVVVDQFIRPVSGAILTLQGSGESTESDEAGQFSFSGLDPGTYFVSATKILFAEVQASVEVVAGVAEPKLLNIQMTKLVTATPFLESHQFNGFYECAFALTFITDSCDMAARTAHDAGATAVPRQLQNNINTAYFTWTDDILSIVQEGFWDEDATPNMWMMVDSTPIDNGCDCSDYTYVEAESGPPTYGRVDIPAEPSPPGNWPMGGEDVAIRGFVPFTPGLTDVAYAVDVEFNIFTTFFHNYIPQEGWNIQEQDQYPVPT